MAEPTKSPNEDSRSGPLEGGRWILARLGLVVELAATIALIIRAIKRGETPALLLAIAGVVFGAAALLVIRKYRRRRPTRLEQEPALPSKKAYLRGLMPFEQGDSLLGRKWDLGQLLAKVASSEFKFGYLSSDEVGTGKTSLIRAGLIGEATKASLAVIYVQNLGVDPVLALRDAAGQTLREPSILPSDASLTTILAEVRREQSAKRLLIVCDQAEEFFLACRTVVQRKPFLEVVDSCLADANLKAGFLFSIRKDFVDELRMFESVGIPQPLDMRYSHRLKNWDSEEALRVLQDASKSDGVPFAQDLMVAIVDDLAGTDSEVRPVELQIVAQSLAESRVFDVDGYGRARRAGGVLKAFIERTIDPVDGAASELERQVARCLLRSLCPSQGDVKRASGRSLRELQDDVEACVSKGGKKDSGATEQLWKVLAKVIERCRKQYVVMLEDGERYNLTHDYIVRPIREATSGEETQKRRGNRLLDRYLDIQRTQSDVRIPWRDFVTIWLFADAEERNDPRAALLLKRSRTRIVAQIGVIVLVLSVVAGVMTGAASAVKRRKAEDRLADWNLPRDLYRHQEAFDTMSLPEEVNSTDWIADSIKNLDLRASRITDLRSLPKHLETLNIADVPVNSLAGIPATLRALTLGSNSELSSLRGLPRGLRFLSLGTLGTSNLEGIPALKELVVAHSELDSLKGIPGTLEILTLDGTQVKGLDGLPDKILELRLLSNPRLRLKGKMPPNLARLEIDKVVSEFMPNLADLPRSLRELRLSRVKVRGLAGLPLLRALSISVGSIEQKVNSAEWPQLPLSLRSLALLGPTGIPSIAPPLLESYTVDIAHNNLEVDTALKAGGKTPPSEEEVLETLLAQANHLLELNVMFARLDRLPPLPKTLQSLTLEGSDLRDAGELPDLYHLRIRNNHVLKVLARLKGHLRTLDLAQSDGLELIDRLPDGLRCLNLHGAKGLRQLPRLPVSLRALDITGTRFSVSSLTPDVVGRTSLRALAVDPRKVKSLRRLPASVRELDFKAQDDFCEREERLFLASPQHGAD